MNNMMVDPITGQPLAKTTSPVNPMTGMPVQAMPNQAVYGNQAVSNAATNIFGTPEQRQGTVAFMTEAQEKAFGPGSEVYESGNTKIYDALKEKQQ